MGSDLSVSAEAPSVAETQVEFGIVREIDGEPTLGRSRVGVEITAPGECDRCLIKENCYASGSLVWATSTSPLAPGAAVRLEMRAGTVLKATGWIYGIPLVALATGLLAGFYRFFDGMAEQPQVLLSAALGLSLMGVAGALMSRFNEWIGSRISIQAFPIQPSTVVVP